MVDIRSEQVRGRTWLSRIALLALAAAPAVAAFACNLQGDTPFAGLGGATPIGTGTVGPSPNCIGPDCPAQCEQHPHPGCKCDVDGQHLHCGKVDTTYPDGTPVCGQGVSVCTDG